MTYEQDNQFEKLARYLDGEDVELTPADRELLDEFNRNEAEIAPQLDVDILTSTIKRTQRRMNAAVLAKSQPRSALAFRFVGVVGMAAALILGIGLFWANYNKSKPEKSPNDVQIAQDDTSDIDADMMFEAVEEQLAMQEETELLALLEPLYTEDFIDIWSENNGDANSNGT